MTKKTKNQVFNIATDLLIDYLLHHDKSVYPYKSTLIDSTTSHLSYSLSELEAKILRENKPIRLTLSQENELNSKNTVLPNRSELNNWPRTIPVCEYKINQDSYPLKIQRKSHKVSKCIREIAVRYLKPPTPSLKGEIILTQKSNQFIKPAPPLIFRQQPSRPVTSSPLIFRELPPARPPQPGVKRIIISGKNIPPPPRKVIIERLAPFPSRAGNILVERWLPYKSVKRRVIYKKSKSPDRVPLKPRNVIIQWETPDTKTIQRVRHLEIINADPVDYVTRHGPNLIKSDDLPDFIKKIPAPSGIVLASDVSYSNNYSKLIGDIEALRLIDLKKEGLYEYESYVKETESMNSRSDQSDLISENEELSQNEFDELLRDIFEAVDYQKSGFIGLEEATALIININIKMGQIYKKEEIDEFLSVIDKRKKISFDDFKSSFKI